MCTASENAFLPDQFLQFCVGVPALRQYSMARALPSRKGGPIRTRLRVSYAVELLRAGVQPVVEEVDKGNEACAACIREHKDALAAVVLRRWMRGVGDMERLSSVADYVHCK